MKKLKLVCLLWMLIIILGCKTIEYVEVPVMVYVEVDPELDPPPVRNELLPREEGTSLSQHLMIRALYYQDLVKQWESWGIQVYEAVDLPLPLSLQSAKKQMEVTDE